MFKKTKNQLKIIIIIFVAVSLLLFLLKFLTGSKYEGFEGDKKFKHIYLKSKQNNILEVQCWVDNVNHALEENGSTATFTTDNINETKDDPWSEKYSASKGIDNDITTFAHDKDLYTNYLVTLPKELPLSKIQRIVIVPRNPAKLYHRYNAIEVIQLLSDDKSEVLAIDPEEIDETIQYVNFIGPDDENLKNEHKFTENMKDIILDIPKPEPEPEPEQEPVPEEKPEPQGAECPSATFKCLADFGTEVGQPLCCGQTGVLQNSKYTCPEELPHCTGYKCGSEWGKCVKKEEPVEPVETDVKEEENSVV